MLAAALLATAVLGGHPAAPATVASAPAPGSAPASGSAPALGSAPAPAPGSAPALGSAPAPASGSAPALGSAPAPASASASAPVCRGQFAPAPPDPNAEVNYYRAQRGAFGFRNDAAYVRLLMKRGLRAPDVGNIPVTAAEKRYLELRGKLVLGARAEAYIKRHRAVYGGISIEDDWPGGPYVLVRLSRDRAHYERALRRLVRYPRNLRTRLVPYSYDHLLKVQGRIERDLKALAAAGFDVEGAGPNPDAGGVDIQVITQRADAAAYFARRYGPVRVHIIATEPASPACTPAAWYEIAPDGLGLVVHWRTGGGAKNPHIELVEQPDRVTVGVVEQVPNGARTSDQGTADEAIVLSAPLGDRPVYDAADGRRLIQQGPSPGDPACPVAAALSPLDQAIATRRARGLPAGREYVRERLRANDFYTPREQRWLSQIDKLVYQPRVDAYLRKHAGEYGGLTVEGRYPATPYVLVRVTRRAALHEKRLKRLTKYPIRTVRVAHTRTELDALAQRIQADAAAAQGFFDGFGRAGFFFSNASRDEATNSVAVYVITRRADAQAYFQARYGAAVRAYLIGTRFECASI